MTKSDDTSHIHPPERSRQPFQAVAMSVASGLALALIAIRFAERPPTPEKTFGYVRAEALSALANSVVLLVLTVYVLYEAYQRFLKPPEIIGGPMLVVAVVGLVVNLVSMKLLSGGASESLNVKGASFEVLSDMLGSLGVIVAAIVVMATGWTMADPIVGAGIGLFIVPRTWSLLKQAVHILLEGTPPEVDLKLLEERLSKTPGVVAVGDLHVWTITSGLDAMSCPLVIDDMARSAEILKAASTAMRSEFNLSHTTIQIEDREIRNVEGHATRFWVRANLLDDSRRARGKRPWRRGLRPDSRSRR